MGHKITFGTDGWRGVIAEDYTFDNVRRCAQGFANYMLSQGKKIAIFLELTFMEFVSTTKQRPARKYTKRCIIS